MASMEHLPEVTQLTFSAVHSDWRK